MQKISKLYQITLPLDQCNELGVKPGNELKVSINHGLITLTKKEENSAPKHHPFLPHQNQEATEKIDQ